MGVVIRQSIKATVINYIGAFIGFYNDYVCRYKVFIA